jgi:hypothetical protein
MSTENLGRPNSYWLVREGFDLYVQVGMRETNRWYGASRISEPVYQPRRARRGDELHHLHGGTYLVSAGGFVAMARMAPYDHLGYNPHAGVWNDGSFTFPLDRLHQVAVGRKVERYNFQQ